MLPHSHVRTDYAGYVSRSSRTRLLMPLPPPHDPGYRLPPLIVVLPAPHPARRLADIVRRQALEHPRSVNLRGALPE